MRKYQALLDSLPIVAEMMGRKYGITVTMGETDTPCTDSDRKIMLPALDPDDATTITYARGWIDHETGHIRHTTPGTKKKARSELCGTLWNILEDVRIESLMGREYPGCRRNLDNVWSTSALSAEQVAKGKILLSDPAQPGWSARNVFMSHIATRGRAEVLGQTKPKATQAATESALRSKFGDDFAGKLNTLVDEVAGLETSEEVLDLAMRCEDLLKEQALPPPPMGGGGNQDKKDGAGEASGDASTGESGGEQEASGDGSSGSPQPSKSGKRKKSKAGKSAGGEPGEAGGDKATGGTAGEADGDADGGNPAGGSDTKPQGSSEGQGDKPGQQAAKDVLDDTRDDGVDPWKRVEQSLAEAGKNPNYDEKVVATQAEGKGAGLELASEQLRGSPVSLEAVRNRTRSLRARAAALLQAQTHKRRLPDKRGRRLITRRLAHVSTGEDKLFSNSMRVQALDTLVHVIWDRSSSMNGTPVRLAAESALGLCLALAPIPGVRVGCYAFPGNRGDVIPLLRPGENPVQRAKRFIPHASGGTPMGSALWQVARAAALERESRKMVFVVTDGQPGDPERTRRIVDKLTKAGFEMMGVGISTDVSHLFKTARTVNSLEDLAPAMFSMLTEALLKYAKKAA